MISYEQRTKDGLFLIMCLMSHHRSARSRDFSRAWHVVFALSQFMQQTRLSRRLFTVPYFFVRSSRCSAFYVPRGASVWDYSSRGGGEKNRGEATMLSTSIRNSKCFTSECLPNLVCCCCCFFLEEWPRNSIKSLLWKEMFVNKQYPC